MAHQPSDQLDQAASCPIREVIKQQRSLPVMIVLGAEQNAELNV